MTTFFVCNFLISVFFLCTTCLVTRDNFSWPQLFFGTTCVCVCDNCPLAPTFLSTTGLQAGDNFEFSWMQLGVPQVTSFPPCNFSCVQLQKVATFPVYNSNLTKTFLGATSKRRQFFGGQLETGKGTT